MRYFNSYKQFLKDKFGARVQKLTIDAGFTCPNRDGSKGLNGCTFCVNDAFNPSYCTPTKTVQQQLNEGIEFLEIAQEKLNDVLSNIGSAIIYLPDDVVQYGEFKSIVSEIEGKIIEIIQRAKSSQAQYPLGEEI